MKMQRFYAGCLVVSAALASPVAGQLALPDTLFRQGADGVPSTSEASDRFGAAFASGDFDDDGFADIAIGVPGEDTKAGAVQVIYGSVDGLRYTPLRQVFFKQSDLSPANGEGAESNDEFGKRLAAGDFNGDGVDDLAIAAPLEHVGAVSDAGAVSVIYGRPQTDPNPGLNLASAQYWTQNSTGVADSAETGDSFGCALAAGNFDNDDIDDNDIDDLAISACNEEVIGVALGGAVHVLMGTLNGLSATASDFLTQADFGGDVESLERFGLSLAVGSFNNDDFDDLVIGVPYDELPGGDAAGSVHVMFGSNGGLTTANSMNIYPNLYEANDQFGASLATGRFNSDSYDDLAIGSPGRGHSGPPATTSSGSVFVYMGHSSQLSFGTTMQSLLQGEGPIEDTPETNDFFGSSLASGRYAEGDSERDYLVIGVPTERIDSVSSAGAVHVLYPSASGFSSSYTQRFFHQNVADFTESCEAADRLGTSLGTGDFNGDGQPDLAIGVPDEDFGALDTGIFHLLEFPSTLESVFEGDFETSDTSQWDATCPDTCS